MTAPDQLRFESASAARKLVERVMHVQPGEHVLITVDERGDGRIVDVTAQAVHAAGAHPIVLRTAARPRDDVQLPPVAAAGAAADVWIDFAVQASMYTDAQAAACAAGTRFGDFLGMDVGALIREIGQVDYAGLLSVGERFIELTGPGATVEVSSPAGTSLRAMNGPDAPTQDGAYADRPGASVAPPGLVTWTPDEASVEGVLVVDGTVWPPDELGPLQGQVILTVERGRIVDIDGGHEAQSLRRWLRSLDSADMMRIAHVSYGFHPGVKSFGANAGENERLFGTIAFGFGAWHGRSAPSHFDVVLRTPSIAIAGRPVQDADRYVDPVLAQRLAAMGVSER